MVNKQSKALRLADALENDLVGYDGLSIPRTGQNIADEAAAELRRQHAENSDFRATCDHLTCENAGQLGEIVALKEQRDELLEALRRIAATSANESGTGSPWVHWVDQARAAIAKATGGAA